jgi:methylglyoxal synthase
LTINIVVMLAKRRAALVRYASKRRDILEWTGYDHGPLKGNNVLAAAVTGLEREQPGLPHTCLQTGSLRGERIRARVADGTAGLVIVLRDQLGPHPPDPDPAA